MASETAGRFPNVASSTAVITAWAWVNKRDIKDCAEPAPELSFSTLKALVDLARFIEIGK